VRLAIYESPLRKWKNQCRRSGGTYKKYCGAGVKHCCCYSESYCEGIPEPVDALRQPAVRDPDFGSDKGTLRGQTIRPQPEVQQSLPSRPTKVR